MSASDPAVADFEERIVGLLLVIQLACAGALWALDSLTEQGEFALFLAVSFVSFAMMSYVYRCAGSDSVPSKPVLLVGCVVVVAMLVAAVWFPV